MSKTTRGLNLLRECNDHGISEQAFRGIYCDRCRNSQCVNAGWNPGGDTVQNRTRISPEEARDRLARRRARLIRLQELNAPEMIIAREKELIADALYELETGYVRVREPGEELI